MILILMRHGDYERHFGALTEKGQSEIGFAASQMPALFQGRSVRIVSSTVKRALESAAIISGKLNLSFEKDEVLYTPGINLRPEQVTMIMWLVRENQTDVLILITHEPVFDDFVPALYREWRINVQRLYRDTGEGLLIDSETKKVIPLPQKK